MSLKNMGEKKTKQRQDIFQMIKDPLCFQKPLSGVRDSEKVL